MWNREVGARISEIRKGRNLTRAEFGDLVGKSEQYVGRIERGTHTIAGDVVNKICDITGVSADYIIRGTVDPLSTIATLSGLSHAQIQVTLEIAAEVIKFLSTSSGNNALMQEALRRSQRRETIIQT